MSASLGFFELLHEPLLVLNGFGVIQHVNKALSRLLGYSDERELVGKLGVSLFAEPGKPLPQSELQQLFAGNALAGLGSTFPVDAIRRDLSRIPVDVVVFRWNCGDTHPFLTALIRPSADKGETGWPGSPSMSANMELACVGHELANLLTPVLGYLELWKLDGNPPLPNGEMADALLNVGRRMHIHVQNLLMLRRRTARTVRPTDVAAAVRRAIGTLEETGVASQHRVQFHNQITGQAQILAESDVLEHAIVNLLLNAAEAMFDPGAIDVTLAAGEGSAELRVLDQGPGIPEGIRDRVFDPFFSTKRNGKGIGLGLYVVSLIAERMDGAIRLESQRPSGASAVFSLPIYRTLN